MEEDSGGDAAGNTATDDLLASVPRRVGYVALEGRRSRAYVWRHLHAGLHHSLLRHNPNSPGVVYQTSHGGMTAKVPSTEG